MGTSVIYLCRLVLMAYFELPFVIAMMLAMKIEDDNTWSYFEPWPDAWDQNPIAEVIWAQQWFPPSISTAAHS